MAGEDNGRLDIAFVPLIPREDIYFCLECKRLNVVKDGKRRTYASEYVLLGMLRFVTGQYSKAVHHGGMMGYVLDGNIPNAVTNVEGNIQQQQAKLSIGNPATFLPSSVLINEARARETRHQRAHESVVFRIHHLFHGTSLMVQDGSEWSGVRRTGDGTGHPLAANRIFPSRPSHNR